MAQAAIARRRSREGVLLLVLLLAGALLTAGAALLGYAWLAVDRLEAERETVLVQRAIGHNLDRAGEAVTTASIWDDAARATSGRIDLAWVHGNFGVYYAKYFQHDVTVLFDSRGQPVYAAQAGRQVAPAQVSAFTDAVRPLVAKVQATELRRRYRPDGRRNHQFDDLATGRGYVAAGDGAFLVAASSVTPETLDLPHGRTPAAVVVSAKAIDAEFMRDLDKDLDLPGLRLARAGEPGLVAVMDDHGRRVARLTWNVMRPGVRIVTRAGGAIAVVLLVVILLGAGVMDRVRRLLASLRDSDIGLERAMADLVAARDQAEAANSAKSQFLANMSHEIRTPLNGVVGVVNVLARSPLDASQQEMVEIIRSSGETLERLLSDVLDLARIESGRMTWEQEPFALGPCIRQVADLMAPRAREKGVRFSVEAGPDTQVRVRGDAVRLKQILTNLLSNAVKFTDRGEVRLTVSPISTASGGFSFTVSDTGVGFEAGQKDSVFGRFQQADGSITRRFGGSGLGLAISRELAELMGGDLDCESRPGEGSTFTLRLPLEPAEEVAGVSVLLAATPEDDGEARPLRILAVDDHPTNRRVLELILDQAGAQVVTAENGREALDLLDAQAFDLVLMDMQMPVMDGISATAALRAREATRGSPRLPVVMLTANAMAEHVRAAIACGADRHLSKPIDANQLLTAIAELTADDEGEDAPPLSATG